MSDFRIASIDTPQARWNPERAEHLHVTYYSPKKVSNSMCENCQQLQARVAGMQAAIQRIIDIERNENPEEDPEADPLGLIALGRDALGTDPSPMLEVVRAAVFLDECVQNTGLVNMSKDALVALLHQFLRRLSDLKAAQPGVWES